MSDAEDKPASEVEEQPAEEPAAESNKRPREEDEEGAKADEPEEEKKAKMDDADFVPLEAGDGKGEEKKEQEERAGPPPPPADTAKNEGVTYTPVVFIGHLPLSGVEDDVLVEFAKPWSPVVRMVTMPNKGQAFLQLKDAEAVKYMVEYYAQTPAEIEGHGSLYVNPAPHAQLTGGRAPGETPVVEVGQPSRIVLVKIYNVRHPITASVMHTLFTMHAPVLKIVVFKKQERNSRHENVMCLAEFETPEKAKIVVDKLQGQNIYEGCCNMVVQFSSQKDSLIVQRNNEYMHDYTRPDLSATPGMGGMGGGGLLGQPAAMPGGQFSQQPPPSQHYTYPAPAAYGNDRGGYNQRRGDQGGSSGRVLYIKNLNEEAVDCNILFRLFSLYGDVEKLKILWDKRSCAMIQFMTREGAAAATHYLQGLELFGRPLKIGEFSHGEVNVGPDGKGELAEYYGRNHPEHRFEKNPQGQALAPPSEKLFISSIPMSWTEGTLRDFLSPAGRIVHIKMLPAKKYQPAIVTMQSVQEAINVITMFHWAVVDKVDGPVAHDLNLRINFSSSNSRDSNRQPAPYGGGGGGGGGGYQQQHQSHVPYQQQHYQPQQHAQQHAHHHQQQPPQQQWYGGQQSQQYYQPQQGGSNYYIPQQAYGQQQQQQQQQQYRPQPPTAYQPAPPPAQHQPPPPQADAPHQADQHGAVLTTATFQQQPSSQQPYQGYGSFLK